MHGTDTLLLELFAIFVWAKIFGELFERLSLPAVLGEILAGVILGPHAARLIAPSENVYAFAEIGAIFVLFTAGLETRPGGETCSCAGRREAAGWRPGPKVDDQRGIADRS